MGLYENEESKLADGLGRKIRKEKTWTDMARQLMRGVLLMSRAGGKEGQRRKRQRSGHEKTANFEDAATGHAGIVLVDSRRYDLRKDIVPRLEARRREVQTPVLQLLPYKEENREAYPTFLAGRPYPGD